MERGDSEVQVFPAFTDVLMIVTLVLVFYLFSQALIVGQTNRRVLRCQRELRQAVEKNVPASLRANLQISEDGSMQRYTFADRVLFDSGKADLKRSGMDALSALGRVFKEHEKTMLRIQIEGHTDKRPIQGPFPSNWELSSARATSVVRFLQERSKLDARLLSATGLSEFHPVDPGDSEEAWARNRRIEVVVICSVHSGEQS
jgi:chemotaxis protein MotB